MGKIGHPTTSNEQPATSNQQPATSNENPNIFWALKNVSFEVEQGEVLGIIGRNGAGKTTLLKILTRITEPTSGTAIINGRVASLLEVGTGFHPELTGRENIFLNGSILGMKKAEITRKFNDVVDFAEIHQFIDTPVKRYSSGMYVRLAFAIAAHMEPDILVVDEVLAVGDLAFQKKCLGKMEEVSREGRTILFVSHNMGAITSLCSRGIILDMGKIIVDSSVVNAVSKYRSFAYNFLDNNSGKVSLEQHPGRKDGKEGLIRFVSCTLEDLEGNVTSVFNLKQTVCVALEYQVTVRADKLKNTSFGVAIQEEDGHFVSYLNTETMGILFDSIPERGIIRCFIIEPPLFPKRYFLTLVCRSNSVITDVIEQAIFFDVTNIEDDKTKMLPYQKIGGVILLDGDWRLDSFDQSNNIN